MKKALLLFVVAAAPLCAHADNIGSCGWGSKLFDGQSGVAPQVLAATTNGTSGNQTFGITSGTSGCTQDGVVKSSWKTAMFIDQNGTMLARDMSAGEGESLQALASLMGMDSADQQVFFAEAKANFSKIYPSSAASTQEVTAGLRQVLASNAKLAKYSQLV